MKAYLVSRVSTDEQKEALPAQSFRLKEYAQKNILDYELFELRESAYQGKRNEFIELIRKIKETKTLCYVVFDKIDRYTRDSSSTEVRELDVLRKSGKIEIHFPSDNLFINSSSPATGLLRLGMGIVVAQYYSDSISDNVKRRFEQKIRDGEWIGMAPVGYINTEKSGRKWVDISEEHAAAVKDAFEMYASGIYSLRAIAKKWRDHYGIKIGSSRIDQILKNPFYYGEMRIKGAVYPHSYQPIISRDLFDKVEEVRNRYKIVKRRYAGMPFPYRGLITCAECGCLITFELKKKKYTYAHCTQKKYVHEHSYINEKKITEALSSNLDSLSIPDDVYVQILEEIAIQEQSKATGTASQRSSLNLSISKLEKRLERLYEDYLDERISQEFHDRVHAKLNKEIRNLQTSLKGLELDENNGLSELSSLLELARNAKNLFQNGNFDEQRELVNMTHSNLLLDGNQLRWELKKPFDLMAFCNKNQTWLPIQVTEQLQGWWDIK